MPVKTKLIIRDEIQDYATADAQGETKDIDRGVDLVAGDGPPGDPPVVFKHAG
jgi:hypothetical protein